MDVSNSAIGHMYLEMITNICLEIIMKLEILTSQLIILMLLNFGNDWKWTEAYFCTFKKILMCVESENSWNSRLARARDRSDKQA